MSEMFEQARAVFIAAASCIDSDTRLSEITTEEADGLIRAVITAMGCPTQAMMDAGMDKVPFGHSRKPTALGIYAAMITAALGPAHE